MKVAFFCSTPYQIILALHIKNLMKSDNTTDIFLLNHFDNVEMIADNLNELDEFRKVTIIDSIGFMEDVKYEGKFLTRLIKKIAIYSNYKKYVEKYVYTGNTNYDSIYYSYPSPIIQLITIYLYNINKKLSINLFEDGIGSYSNSLSSSTFIKKVFNKLLRIDNAVDRYDNLYILNENLFPITTNLKIKKQVLPPIEIELKEKLNKLFKFEQKNKIFERMVFFEQVMDEISKGLDDQMQILLGEIYNVNMLVKLHPRSEFQCDINIKLYDRKDLPWEIIALNSDIDNKVLISYYSTSLITNKTLLNKEPFVIFLFDLVELKEYYWLEDDMVDVVYKLREIYRDKEKIFIPKSLMELKEIIKRLEGKKLV